jgi:hypothetical protein
VASLPGGTWVSFLPEYSALAGAVVSKSHTPAPRLAPFLLLPIPDYKNFHLPDHKQTGYFRAVWCKLANSHPHMTYFADNYSDKCWCFTGNRFTLILHFRPAKTKAPMEFA